MLQPGQYEFYEFRLDTAERALYRQGELVPLTPKALETLLFLVERRGHIVEKDDLMKAVWPDTFVEEASLSRNIFVLRKTLSDGQDGRAFIETIPKRGYRFVADVQIRESDATTSEERRESPADLPTSETPPRRRPLRASLLVVASLVLLLGVVLALNVAGLRNRLLGYLAGQKIQSLAVLPLENVSGDPSQEYFADGMTDTLITDLAKIHSLRVISRTSTSQYKGTRKTAPQIARELGVDAIVEGTVLRSGTQVRVTAQLIRARYEAHLWADMYQRDVGDAMTMQGEVARAIADSIRAQVTPVERADLSAARRVDPDVYELYLQGRYFWNKRDPAGLSKAKQYFERAIEKDPNFALGYVGLADTYNVMADSLVVKSTEALPRSREAALKALQIDDNLAEAHASLAYVNLEFDWDWPAAERQFHRSIELNPSYATAHQWYSMYLAAMGRCDESLAEIRRAEVLDPLSLIIRLDEAAEAYWCRHLDLAVDEIRRVIEIAPDYPQARFYIAGGYVDKGMFEQGEAEFKKGLELAGGAVLSSRVFEAWMDSKSGKQLEARRILDEVRKASDESGTDDFLLAATYGNLGDRDTAFEYLEKAYRNRVYWLIYLKLEPRFDSLRDDPRFHELLRRMHLD